jgi:hypothetical protein
VWLSDCIQAFLRHTSTLKLETACIIYNRKITRHNNPEDNSLNKPHRRENLKSCITKLREDSTLQPRRWRQHVCPKHWQPEDVTAHVITGNGTPDVQPVTACMLKRQSTGFYITSMWAYRHWQGMGKQK